MKRFIDASGVDMPHIYCDRELLGAFRAIPQGFYNESVERLDWDESNVVILHHDDSDGLCSASAIYTFEKAVYNSNIIMHCISDYDVDPAIYAESIEDADIVYLVDLSFKQHKIDYLAEHANVFVWIDHHHSSLSVKIDDMFSDKVFKFVHSEVGVSAAALCWIYTYYAYYVYGVYANTGERNVENIPFIFCTERPNIIPIPDIIKTVSLYDTFHPDANQDFSFGIYASGLNLNPDGAWYDMIDPYFKLITNNYVRPDRNALRLAEKTLDEIFNNGRAARRWADSFYARYREENLIEFDLRVVDKEAGTDETYKIAAMNIDANSLSFGDVYYKVDGVIKFTQSSSGTYKFSMYANLENEHHIDCAKVAMSLGGGGHIGAAGWRCKENLIEKFIKGDYVIYV